MHVVFCQPDLSFFWFWTDSKERDRWSRTTWLEVEIASFPCSSPTPLMCWLRSSRKRKRTSQFLCLSRPAVEALQLLLLHIPSHLLPLAMRARTLPLKLGVPSIPHSVHPSGQPILLAPPVLSPPTFQRCYLGRRTACCVWTACATTGLWGI